MHLIDWRDLLQPRLPRMALCKAGEAHRPSRQHVFLCDQLSVNPLRMTLTDYNFAIGSPKSPKKINCNLWRMIYDWNSTFPWLCSEVFLDSVPQISEEAE